MARRPASAAFELVAAGEAGHFRLGGVLNFDTARAVLDKGTAAFGEQQRVSLALSGITHADSAGLAVLLTWIGRARRAGRAISYTALPVQLSRIARVCGVESLLGGLEDIAAGG
ncbi:MAG TPA: STAS domain-containing protein [Steroidobacteraceae bacterium]|nr:STAS domain-containing protein [Steroidobacteraceae bacterium]